MSSKVVAICCSDIHLSHKPPLLRTAEPDWYEAQARPLSQLRSIADYFRVPILYAGDIFHTHNEPAECINFAIEHLPYGHAVPGQHDLPFHQINDINKSAFWTLVQAGKIDYLAEGRFLRLNNHWCFHGVPWGCEIPKIRKTKGDFNIALIHAFVWAGSHGYKGAPIISQSNAWDKRLDGFNVAIFGDNHKGFADVRPKRTIYNCGAFIRRRTDDLEHKPAVGLICDDGTVHRYFLDTSEDRYMDLAAVNECIKYTLNSADFIEQLDELGSEAVVFSDRVRDWMRRHKVSKGVTRVLLELLEKQ